MALKRLTATFFLAAIAVLSSPKTEAQESRKTSSGKVKLKEICITFDELPAAKSFGEVDRQAVNYLLLGSLKDHQVPAIGFVVGDQIEDSFDLLGQWLNNKHRLGTLTYTNQDYNYLEIEAFLEDIRRGIAALEPMLSGFGQKKRYFRYPYQHYGSTVTGKEQASLFLNDQNVTVVHATVIPEDYLYNLTLDKLGKIPDSAAFENLMNEYVNHVLDKVEEAERLALDIIGRPIRQIILLRANRLNAVYMDDLLTALEDAGYCFVSIDHTLKDKIYAQDEAYYGLKGISYLERILRSDPDLIPAR